MDQMKLLKSRELANSVRYSRDLHDSSLGLQPSSLQEVTDLYYRNAVEIHKDMTPELEQSVFEVCKKLSVERSVVTVFVNSSAELQAACYYTDTQTCLIRFSSALVNLLDPKEFEFVLGHEIGHFLLQHAPSATNCQSAEYFNFQRAKEISADRVGLIGCGDFLTSAKALIKTASGLESRLLKVDVNHYLTQIERISHPDIGENPLNTHPSMLIRTKALNDFSRSNIHKNYGSIDPRELFVVDSKITEHLDKYVDKKLRQKIKKACDDLTLWIVAKKITEDGKFDKIEQKAFSDFFGIETLEKFKNFLNSVNTLNVKKEIENKLFDSKQRLESLSPDSLKKNYDTAIKVLDLF